MLSKKSKQNFTRKYDISYIKYGFVAAKDTKHPSHKDKPVDFFDRKKRELDLQKQILKATTSANSAASRASYLVAHRIAKAKKPFTVGEELILHAAKDIRLEL